MVTKTTEVRWTTSKARKEIDKLVQKVKQAGKEAKKSFDGDATKGVKKFGDAVSKVNPKLGSLVSKVGKFATGGGAIAAGFAAAGASVLAVVANAFDLAGQLADIDARLEVINQTAERSLKFQDLASSIGDADENVRLQLARRALSLQQANLAFRQNEVEEARNAAKELVAIRKQQLAEVDSAFRQSVSNRESAEARLRQKINERTVAGVGAGEPAGRAVGTLTSRAQQEAQKGNVDVAEALISRAQELSSELGNHVFFTNQIEKAQSAVVRALEKDVKQARTKEQTLGAERDQLQGRVDDSAAFAKALDDELKTILTQNRALAAQRKIIKDSAIATKNLQLQEQGQRRFATGVSQIKEISGSVSEQSFAGQFRDQISDAFTAFVKEAGTKAGTIGTDKAILEGITGQLGEELAAVFADGEATPQEIQKLTENISKITEAVAVMEKGIADNSLSAALENEVGRIRSLFTGLENLALGAAQFTQGEGGFNTAISQENTQAARQNLEQIVERREVQQEINVSIEGGMIDNNTIEQITDIIRREVRKEVSKGAGK